MVSVLLIAGLAVVAGHVHPGNVNTLTVAPVPGSPAVTTFQPQPLPTESLIMGPGGQPIEWAGRPSDGVYSLAAVPDGVDMTFQEAGYDDWAGAPVTGTYATTEVAGTVQFLSGTTEDNIGLGCMAADGGSQIGFRVEQGAIWSFIYFPPGDGRLEPLVSGTNQAILPTTSKNEVEVSCAPGPSSGSTHVMAAVNGVPVANYDIGVPDPGWGPAIDQCSCEGVSTGEFTQLAQYAGG